jgi:hypothetical protein
MANLTIEHDSVGTIVLRQSLSNIVLSVDQIQSVIRNLELAALEIRQSEFERKRRDEIRRLRAWDSERRAFAAVYVPPRDSSDE